MDEAAKVVLTKNKLYIKQNLHLENSIEVLDYLEAKELLTSDNVESIKADKINGEKISRLVTILQHKGPTAFYIFLEALTETNSKFLADELRIKYEEEQENLKDCLSVPINSDKDELIIDIDNECEDNNNEDPENPLNAKSNIRLPVFTAEQTICSQSCLRNILHKLKMHLFHMNERELSFGSPAPVNLEMVDDLIDRVLKIQQDCFQVLHVVNQKSLLSHVIDLKESKKKLQTTINSKEEQNNRHIDKIFKLDNKCKDLERTIKSLECRLDEIQDENKDLKQVIENIKQEEEMKIEKSRNLMKTTEAENEMLKHKIAHYESEINKLTERVKILEEKDELNNASRQMTSTQQTAPNTCEQVKPTDDKGKDVVGIKNEKENASHIQMVSTLQDCKDTCRENNVNTLNKLRARVLFADTSSRENYRYSGKVNATHKVNNSTKPYQAKTDYQRFDINGRTGDKHEILKIDHSSMVSNNPNQAMLKLNEKHSKHSQITGTSIKGSTKSPLKKHPSVIKRPTWRRNKFP
ncbi:peptidase C14A [Mactra antiquata]